MKFIREKNPRFFLWFVDKCIKNNEIKYIKRKNLKISWGEFQDGFFKPELNTNCFGR